MRAEANRQAKLEAIAMSERINARKAGELPPLERAPCYHARRTIEYTGFAKVYRNGQIFRGHCGRQ